MTANRPGGWPTVIPRVIVEDTAKQVRFLKSVFKATGRHQTARPSEIAIGDSMLMVSGTDARPAMPVFLYVYVDDVDATFRRALKAGAVAIEEPVDTPYGDRRATFEDSCGNTWQVATRLSVK
jgi:uncharacterized glyoxalase superfamily protein PhnB